MGFGECLGPLSCRTRKQKESWPARRTAPPGYGRVQLRLRTGLTGEQYVTAQGWRDATLEHCPHHPCGGCSLVRLALTHARPHPVRASPAGIVARATPRSARCRTAWQHGCRARSPSLRTRWSSLSVRPAWRRRPTRYAATPSNCPVRYAGCGAASAWCVLLWPRRVACSPSASSAVRQRSSPSAADSEPEPTRRLSGCASWARRSYRRCRLRSVTPTTR